MASKLSSPAIVEVNSQTFSGYFTGLLTMTNYSRNSDIPVFKAEYNSPLPVSASMIVFNNNGPAGQPRKLFVMEVNVKRDDQELVAELRRLLPTPCVDESDPQSGATIGWKIPSRMLVISSVSATGMPTSDQFSIFLLIPASVSGSSDAEYRDDIHLFENQIPPSCRAAAP